MNANSSARLHEAITAYVNGQQSGQTITFAELCVQFADVKDELEHYFASTQSVRPLAMPPQEALTVGYESASRSDDVCTGTLDDYEVGTEIARGGMGVIWRAVHRPLRREVALKVLLADPRLYPITAQRFLEEAQIASQLQHPGVAPVHEIGRMPDGRPFFAMKLIQGRTLAALLAERVDPLTDQNRFLTIFHQITQTLAYAHNKGVIHRDLKPLNVMVGAFGEVQVMDWGLAKVVSAPISPVHEVSPASSVALERTDELQTQAGSVMGTFAYMPPEQAQGDIAKVDRRADVFALGAILCEILTGQPPYTGHRDALLTAATHGDLQPAFTRIQRSGADAEIIALVLRCLNPNPDERPTDASKVADAMADYLANVAEKLRAAEIERATSMAKASEQRRRRQLQSAFVAVVVLTLFVGGGLVWWAQQQRLARRTTIEDTVQDAMARADQLRQQAIANGSATIPQAEQTLVLMQQARDKAEEAERAADDPLLTEQLKTEAATLAHTVRTAVQEAENRLAQAKREARFLDELAEARTRSGETSSKKDQAPAGAFDAYYMEGTIQLDQQYRAAFQRLGIDVIDGPRATTTKQIVSLTQGEVRNQAILALYYWSQENLEGDVLAHLNALIEEVDPDPWRQRFRLAYRAKDKRTALTDLVPEMLKDVHPAHNYQLLADALKRQEQRTSSLTAITLLQRGHVLYPNDTWISEALGDSYDQQRYWLDLDQPAREQAGRLAAEYFRVALVMRPTSMRLRSSIAYSLPRQEGIAWLLANVQAFPNDATLHARLAELFKQADDPRAFAEYARAVELAPSSYHCQQMDYYLQHICDHQRRKAFWQAVTDKQPTFAEGFHFLGLCLADENDLHGARRAKHKAYELDPTAIRLGDYALFLLESVGESDEAERLLRAFVERHPDDLEGQTQLGVLLEKRTNWAGAKQIYQAILARQPTAKNTYQLARMEHALGHPDEATQLMRAYVGQHPQSEEGNEYLADILAETGDVSAALKHLLDTLPAEPSYPALTQITLFLGKDDHLQAMLTFWQAFMAKHPTSSTGQYYLGLAYLEANQYQDAIKSLMLSLGGTAVPNVFRVTTLPRALRKSGDTKGAKDYWADIVRKNPRDGHLWLNYGQFLAELQEWDQAIIALRRSLTSEADSHYYNVLADVYLKRNRKAEAIAVWHEWLAKRPHDGEGLSRLAQLYHESGDDTQAYDYLRRCFIHRPRCTSELNNAREWFGADRWALYDLLQTYVRYHRGETFGYCLLGEMYHQDREYATAERIFRQAHTLDPLSNSKRYLDVLYRDTGEHHKAITFWQAYLAKYPDEAAAHAALVPHYQALKQVGQAEGSARAALRLEHNAANANQLAEVLLASKRVPEATDVLNAYRQQHPMDSDALRNYAHFLNTIGRTAEAIPHLEQAIKLKPNDVSMIIDLASMYLKDNQLVAAIRVLEQHKQRLRSAHHVSIVANMMTTAIFNIFQDEGDMVVASKERYFYLRLVRQAVDRWFRTIEQMPTKIGAEGQLVRNWLHSEQLRRYRRPLGLALLPADERAAWQSFWQRMRDWHTVWSRAQEQSNQPLPTLGPPPRVHR